MEFNSIVSKYQDNLKKIISNKEVPVRIKGKAGVLKENIKKNNKDKKDKSPATYNLRIQTNNGTVFGDIINNNSSRRGPKKQKVDHIEEQEDVWEAVRQYLEASTTHDFCLEKYHIIKCGYLIKCDPSLPNELWAYFNNNDHTIATPFQTYSQYTASVLTIMRKNNIKAIEKAIKSIEEAEESIESSQKFVEEFFLVCIYIYKRPNLYERLSVNETSFNHSFIWLIMEFVVDSMPNISLKFAPAEHFLDCSKEEYKADACIIADEDEISILETSGKILLNDNSKYGSDHIKVHFGALTMFNAIYKKYYWASEATALKLHIPFLHARHDMLHLWSLGLCSSELYCSKKEFKSKVPKDMTESKDITALGNLSWRYKCLLEDAVNIIKTMKEEHEEYSLQKVLLNTNENRTPLSTLLKVDIQKPVKGSGYNLLLPEENDEDESPIRYTGLK
ncbi:hypothetical protein CU098_004429 [Rhizopus stolonifer]|uniref:Uncharacterized protein n=1 Tax=Rhizopus stolonifer TaxID=4846 RepID=A0A367IUC9_RHIST|nr:hypothetical protein CU098_004429 [Rhizopus stolonifer]